MIVLQRSAGEHEVLGETIDDAVGEAYDKVAKLLCLGYPGGPLIDRLAASGTAARCPLRLTAPMSHPDSLEFSFSGVKSAIARHAEGSAAPRNAAELADLCAHFQDTLVSVLVKKTLRAARRFGRQRVVLAGGVAANRQLRTQMAAACERAGLALWVPDLVSCTDNAAMIAYAGALALERGERMALAAGPSSQTVLGRLTRKGGGKRAS